MDQDNSRLSSTHMQQDDRSLDSGESRQYEPPKFEVISLDCEITAYAPDDGDRPLF